MPPAGRAAALAIFNLGAIRTSENRAPKWEEAFADDAFLPSHSNRTASKRQRHEEVQNTSVIVAQSRPKRQKNSVTPVAKLVSSLKQEEGRFGSLRDDTDIKAEPTDDVVPVATLDLHEEVSDEQISDALSGLKNPSAKLKKSSAMPDRILYTRLKVIGFDLYPVEDSVNKYFPFSRYFFAQRFGGSFVDTFPRPSAKMLKKHGINDWGFLSLLYNPHAPQVPGAPGLFYVVGDTSAETPWTKRIFVRLDDDKWLYVGSHAFSPVASLTVAEYELLSAKVRGTWTGRIAEAPSWAHDVLARIYLRSVTGGKEPSDEEVDELLAENKDVIKTVTEDQVAAAFSHGEEKLGVWAMKCIGYDADWIAELVEEYPNWKEEFIAARRSKGKKSKQGSHKGKEPAKRRTLKRKASPIDTTSEDEDEDEEGSELTDVD